MAKNFICLITFFYLLYLPTKSFCHSWEYNLTIYNVQSFFQAWVGFTSLFPTHICQTENVRKGCIGQRECRSARYGSRDIGYTIMTRVLSVQPDKTISFGKVTLDCASYDLNGPGGSTKLAGKEFQMMEMLMRNPRKLVSTETFMDRIWGYDSEAELNIVWVYISTLRKKLKGIDADVEIKAQRGVGYYLEVKS